MQEVLSDNRNLNLDMREELNMQVTNLEKSSSYQIGMEKGNIKDIIERKPQRAYDQALVIASIASLPKAVELPKAAKLN